MFSFSPIGLESNEGQGRRELPTRLLAISEFRYAPGFGEKRKPRELFEPDDPGLPDKMDR